MKIHSKLPRRIAIAGSVVTSMSLAIMPISGFALGQPAGTVSSTSKTTTFCGDLSTKAATISGPVTNLIGKANGAWGQQNQKLSTAFKKVNQNVAADRQKADSQRQVAFSKLATKATTAAQKQAMLTYEASVQTAISVRRNAYDAARQTFRAGLQSVVTARRSTVSDQFAAFQSSVARALSIAEASCAASPNGGPTIRQTLQASLKSARLSVQSDRKNDATVGSQLTQLAATRVAAFKAADQTFQASLTTARQTLQQAFGKKSV